MGTLKQLGLTGGETLLVLGAAEVGMIATQLAVSRGATVVGAAASRDHNLVRDLGAVPVSYGPGSADRVRQIVPSVHAVLDAAGKGGLPDAIDLAGGSKEGHHPLRSGSSTGRPERSVARSQACLDQMETELRLCDRSACLLNSSPTLPSALRRAM